MSSSYFQTLRERERNKRGVFGSSPTPAPKQSKPRRVKNHPAPAVPCRVKNSNGEYYDLIYDLELTKEILVINPNNPDGHLFQSRRKASRRVYLTIFVWNRDGLKWVGPEFILENMR